jgi:hypothetical protein
VVAERVVDFLEAVEVHQHHGHEPFAGARGREGALDPLAEQRAVGQAGQGVVVGLVLVELGLGQQRLLGRLAL